jgi:hypothetical protein
MSRAVLNAILSEMQVWLNENEREQLYHELTAYSTEDQLNETKTKYLTGALHELAETGALTLLKIDEVKEFHNFKSQYEWLEKRLGLRPR